MVDRYRTVGRRGFAAGAFAGLACLSGCAMVGEGPSADDDPDPDRPLEILHGWTGGAGARAMSALVSAFHERNPGLETSFEAVGGEGSVPLEQAITRRFERADPPSAFAAVPGRNLAQYEETLGDVTTDVWNAGDLFDAHLPEVVDACRSGDDLVAVPIGAHRTNDLFYNVEVLADAGVDPQAIGGFDAWIDALETVATETDATPYVDSLLALPTLAFWAATMLGTQGPDAYLEFVAREADRDAVRGTFAAAERVLSTYLPPDAERIGVTEATRRLLDGDAAFTQQGGWIVGQFADADVEYGEDWGSVPFPGTGDVFGLALDAFVAPGGELANPTPERTHRFLRFVGSETAHTEFNRVKGSIPTRDVEDRSGFDAYQRATIDDVRAATHRPPALASGLAVDPSTRSALEDALIEHFLGPFDVEAATEAFLTAVEEPVD